MLRLQPWDDRAIAAVDPGTQAYNAPDLAVTLDASRGTCATGLTLVAHVKNQGSVSAPKDIEVAFYKGTAPGGTLLTKLKTTTALLPGAIEDISFLVPGAKDGAAYYVVVDGATVDLGFINECIESNNAGAVGVVSCSKD